MCWLFVCCVGKARGSARSLDFIASIGFLRSNSSKFLFYVRRRLKFCNENLIFFNQKKDEKETEKRLIACDKENEKIEGKLRRS